jgi:adenylosuccinate synthase
VLGIAKAYTTRVGGGPFPTELKDDIGGGLQERGKEFGATTGRPRRCGWFDGVVARYATRVNGLTSLAVTKLDVLDGCKEIKLCTGYRYGGKVYRDMPADLQILENCEPVYETFKGWTAPTTGITSYQKLPPQAKRYLARVEEVSACPIAIISTGSRREDTIVLRNPMAARSKRAARRAR